MGQGQRAKAFLIRQSPLLNLSEEMIKVLDWPS